MTDSVQFCVVRINTNLYRVIVQDEETIIRADEVSIADIIDKLGYELEQLKSND